MGIFITFTSFLALAIRLALDKTNAAGIREAFLKSSVICGTFIAVSTELLSFYQSFNAFWVHVVWLSFAAVNVLLLVRFLSTETLSLKKVAALEKFRESTSTQSWTARLAWIGILVTLSVCLFTAIRAAPNNYDSMTYHMARVMHWIQNQSVDHYPTHNLRQISFAPGSGYIIAHLQLLSGGDFFANAVQWLAFFGCILGTSLLSEDFGRSQDQILTALACASVPMAIMQATTTQTDLSVSFWLICFLHFLYQSRQKSAWGSFWFLAGSFGLAISTKPTAFIFGLPLLVIYWLRESADGFYRNTQSAFKALLTSAGILICASALSLPSYWRNFQTFGQFFGIDNGTRIETIGIEPLFSNILRNTALNLPLQGFWNFVQVIHQSMLKLDVNDPSTTFTGAVFSPRLVGHLILPDEDFVGSPIHFILIILSLGSSFVTYFRGKNPIARPMLLLALANLLGFLLFCLLIKWQIWGNRLILPFFILNAPIIAFVATQYLGKINSRLFAILLSSIAVFYSITPIHHPIIALPQQWTHHSQSQSILRLTRDQIYHSSYGKELEKAYRLLKNHADKKNCSYIGVEIGEDDCEYPIWVTLPSNGVKPVKIKHLNVSNPSRKTREEFEDAKVCLVFSKQARHIRIFSKE